MIITCPMCHAEAFDDTVGECRQCHIRAAIGEEPPLQTILDGMVHNARLRVAELADEGFQQVLGAFDDELFSEEMAKVAHRAFLAAGILCEHIAVTTNAVSHSLVLSRTERGMQCALGMINEIQRQNGALIEIIPLPLDS